MSEGKNFNLKSLDALIHSRGREIVRQSAAGIRHQDREALLAR